MAIINCPECGKEVSDKARTCPSCGYRINTPPNQIGRAITAHKGLFFLAVLIIISICFFAALPKIKANVARRLAEEEQTKQEALVLARMEEEMKHAIAVENDHEAPIIHCDIDSIRIEVNEKRHDFKGYKNQMTVTDNVDGEISNEKISCSIITYYNTSLGEHEAKYTVSDEAGNIGEYVIKYTMFSKYEDDEYKELKGASLAVGWAMIGFDFPEFFEVTDIRQYVGIYVVVGNASKENGDIVNFSLVYNSIDDKAFSDKFGELYQEYVNNNVPSILNEWREFEVYMSMNKD